MTRQGSSDRTEAQGCAKRNYRDMSQAAFAAFKFTGFVFVIVRHNSRDVFADPA